MSEWIGTGMRGRQGRERELESSPGPFPMWYCPVTAALF